MQTPGPAGGFLSFPDPPYMRNSSRPGLYLTALLLLLYSGFCPANDYLEQLLQQADAQKLAALPEWRNLLHYQPSKDGLGVVSPADTDNFFLAADGKYNAQAELHATLHAFFSTATETATEQNPQCAFIARYHWLKEKLNFDPKKLSEQTCSRFNEWYRAINPAQATLIFPAGYVNNPSSMFGHTLLRIDRPNQTERTRLASYAINYAADTNESNGLVFSVKAIVGGYPGSFSILPYYEKVKEYSDLENRDIWEYQLNLTAAEIRRLLEHAWELGPVSFDYYFFDENCSYQLLTLLDVARPGMGLSDRFTGWVIPSDTVRVVLNEQGLLRQTVYRPSSQTLLHQQLDKLDDIEQQLALQLAQGELTPSAPAVTTLTESRRARVLEAAYDYLQYQFNTGKWPRDEAANRSLDLLRARSLLKVKTDTTAVPIPVRPDQGHATARLALYYGSSDDQPFTDVYLRPSYHDLMDADAGYQYGAEINFFDFHIRSQARSGTLEQFTLIDIVSLTPRDRFFMPVSWRISTGLERFELPQTDDRPLVFNVRGGAGPSYRLSDNQLVSLMLEGALLADSKLPDGYTTALGPSLRWLWSDTQSDWRVMLTSRQLTYYNKIDRGEIEHQLQSNLRLSTNTSLRLSYKLYGDPAHPVEESSLGFNWYF